MTGRSGRGRPGILLPALSALLALLLLPREALAWGPGTHVALGEAVLGALALLPGGIRALLRAHPLDYLYGSVAADISLGKKYATEGRHCHHWHIGEEIFSAAGSPELKAVALGYLAHLAGDTIAHNFFLPRRLLLTRSTKALGHSYWEHRMDVHLGEGHLARAREVVMEHDHEEADALFDRVLSRTIFSFETNRRIFRGMIRFQDNDRWQQVFDRLLQASRWSVEDEVFERYLALSFDSVVDYLARRRESRAARLDPTGEINLRLAKKLRRVGLAKGGWEEASILEEMAEEFFPLPTEEMRHWKEALEAEAVDALLLPGNGPSGNGGSRSPARTRG